MLPFIHLCCSFTQSDSCCRSFMCVIHLFTFIHACIHVVHLHTAASLEATGGAAAAMTVAGGAATAA